MVRETFSGVVLAGLAVACTPIEADSSEPEAAAPGVVEEAAEVVSEVQLPDPQPRSEGSLTVEVLPRFTHVLAGQSGTLDVLVRVRAAEVPGQERPPLDLALVLDRSGSMAGDKLHAAKQAALETLRQLGDDDRITFISYDDGVIIHSRRVPAGAGRRSVRAAMLGLQDGGGTALGPALKDGLDVLTRAKRSDEVLAHVMLLSDGLANEGESRPEVLAGWTAAAFSSGVGVSTLGVGLDYNEDLMTKIADAGGGRYHFIEGADQVPEVLGEEFAGLSSTVARNVTLTLAPEVGLEVDDVPGYPVQRDGAEVMAKVGSLAGGRKREMVVRLDYEAPKNDAMPLGAFTINFKDTLADGADREIVVHPAVAVTHDQAKVDAGENFAVTVRTVEFEVAATMQLASEQVEQGQFDDARSLLRTKRDELKKRAEQIPDPQLDGMVDELDEAANKVGDAERDRQEMKRFKKSFKSKAYRKRKK